MLKNKIAIIGAGKVGAALGIVLQSSGYEISGVLSQNYHSSIKLATTLHCTAYTAYKNLLAGADIVLLTVPDRAIVNTAQELVASGGLNDQQAVFHVCGSQSAESLACIRHCKIPIGSMHPLQSFARDASAIDKIAGTYFAVDGDPQAVVIAQEMIAAIGGLVLLIPQDKRAIYHAAACMAANYLVAIVHGATTLLEKCGIPERQGLQALRPLLEGALENVQTVGTVTALTGPIARGDAVTVEKHLQQIDSLSPAEASLYRSVGEYTVAIAAQQNTWSVQQIAALRQLFK